MRNLGKLEVCIPFIIMFAVFFIASAIFGSLAFNYKKQLNEQILANDNKLSEIRILRYTISDLKVELVEARSSDKENDKVKRAKPQLIEWVYKHSQISRTMTEKIVNDISKTSYPLFLLALMKTESHFNPTAVSSKGAMGLGQIMPIHKKALAKVGILKEMRDIFSISVAVKATEFIWGLKIAQANGDINKALALYLGGSNKSYVNQILKDYFQLNYLSRKPLTSKKADKEIEFKQKTGNVKDNVEIIKEYVYIVKSGDMLSKIAKRAYGETNKCILKSIKNANPDIKNTAIINIGQKIILPIINIKGIFRSPNILNIE